MRGIVVAALVFLAAAAELKVAKDKRGDCQISVPGDWAPLEGSAGVAVLRDPTTALAAVTSQPGQEFQPLSEKLQKIMGVPKERMFENSAKRVFYQDKVSQSAEDQNGFSVSVPGKGGTCSCRVAAVPEVKMETVKAIALSLAAAEK